MTGAGGTGTGLGPSVTTSVMVACWVACLALGWLEELRQDFGKVFRWPNRYRQSSLMSLGAVAGDLRALRDKLQSVMVLSFCIAETSVVSAPSCCIPSQYFFAESKITFLASDSFSMANSLLSSFSTGVDGEFSSSMTTPCTLGSNVDGKI